MHNVCTQPVYVEKAYYIFFKLQSEAVVLKI